MQAAMRSTQGEVTCCMLWRRLQLQGQACVGDASRYRRQYREDRNGAVTCCALWRRLQLQGQWRGGAPACPASSHRLWNMTAQAMTKVCPASSPFTPARMLMALVQNTTSMTMYTLYRAPSSRYPGSPRDCSGSGSATPVPPPYADTCRQHALPQLTAPSAPSRPS